AARQTGVRTLAHRRPVGGRRCAGAGRGDRDRRRARSRTPAEHSREAAVACEQAAKRVPVADASLTHGVWLERVPDLVAECVEEWGLQLGEPYVGGAAGHAQQAELPDGTPGGVKVWVPPRGSARGADGTAC